MSHQNNNEIHRSDRKKTYRAVFCLVPSKETINNMSDYINQGYETSVTICASPESDIFSGILDALPKGNYHTRKCNCQIPNVIDDRNRAFSLLLRHKPSDNTIKKLNNAIIEGLAVSVVICAQKGSEIYGLIKNALPKKPKYFSPRRCKCKIHNPEVEHPFVNMIFNCIKNAEEKNRKINLDIN